MEARKWVFSSSLRYLENPESREAQQKLMMMEYDWKIVRCDQNESDWIELDVLLTLVRKKKARRLAAIRAP
jgi:hypothetical protein